MWFFHCFFDVHTGHNEDGYRKLQKSFFNWLFCEYLWPSSFLYSTSALIRLNYINCCRTNYYQKHICFSRSIITYLIYFGSNSMLLMARGDLAISAFFWGSLEKKFLPVTHIFRLFTDKSCIKVLQKVFFP
jgi:hypothetical protein